MFGQFFGERPTSPFSNGAALRRESDVIKSSSFRRRAKSSRILRSAIMSSPAVLAALSLTQSAKALSCTGISNGTLPVGGNSIATATGTWDIVTPNWNTASDGTGTGTGVWTGGTAVFSAGTNVTGASVITVSGTSVPTGITGITFEEGTVTLATGTVTLSGASAINVAAATGTISGILAGSVGFTKTGTGLLLLSNTANSYSGPVAINAGAVRFNVASVAWSPPPDRSPLAAPAAVAGFNYAITQTDLANFTSSSTGTVAMALGTTASTPNSNALDFSAATGANLPNVFLGALTGNNATISGTITPFGTAYQLGSGGGTLSVASTLTAGHSITIGNGVTSGTVNFSAGPVVNQTTADVTLNNLGTLVVGSDADLGDNVTNTAQTVQFNGGILSIGGTNPTINHNMNFGTGAGGSGGTITTTTTPTLTGTISGSNAMTKLGTGKLILASTANTYNGAVTITAGALEVNSTLPATSIAVTGTLGGVGTISNGGSSAITVAAGGHLAPGLDTSLTAVPNPTLTLDNLTLSAANSNVDVQLGASGVNDVVNVTASNGFTAAGGRRLTSHRPLVLLPAIHTKFSITGHSAEAPAANFAPFVRRQPCWQTPLWLTGQQHRQHQH